ncbi:hypothetical protein WA026_004680 [Henosepilachna vigintioctopunctata]|uniref:TRASH domain-containing protein n=1 Tax=Henosepilachna vigintioctopunctata TaxID=420089 RepID=A0AAW1V140_9CUCU
MEEATFTAIDSNVSEIQNVEDKLDEAKDVPEMSDTVNSIGSELKNQEDENQISKGEEDKHSSYSSAEHNTTEEPTSLNQGGAFENQDTEIQVQIEDQNIKSVVEEIGKNVKDNGKEDNGNDNLAEEIENHSKCQHTDSEKENDHPDKTLGEHDDNERKTNDGSEEIDVLETSVEAGSVNNEDQGEIKESEDKYKDSSPLDEKKDDKNMEKIKEKCVIAKNVEGREIQKANSDKVESEVLNSEKESGNKCEKSVDVLTNVVNQNLIENSVVCEEISILEDQENSDKPIENVSIAPTENETEGEQSENTEFVQVNSEKDDIEKDASKADELLEDPIGGDDNDNLDSMAEGADEELCIIPDTKRVLSQEEKDAACTLNPLKDLAAADSEDGENSQNSQNQDTTITVIKYKEQEPRTCHKCLWVRTPKYEFKRGDCQLYLCNDSCLEDFKKSEKGNIVLNWESEIRVKDLTPKTSSVTFRRICAGCKEEIYNEETNLTWEIMDFCNESCLTKYQKEIGSKCASCSGDVRANSLGKYCVRFGYDIRQFCSSHCLENYKKGLKVCSYCQKDMTGPEGFLVVGDKGQFKDFCSQVCIENYDMMTNNRPPKVAEGTTCCVCNLTKPISMSFEHGGTNNFFCSEPCFVAFSFVNNIKAGKCAMCRRSFSSETLEKYAMFYENSLHSFCSNSCQNIYIIAHRKIVPCTWCKVKKYNFDLIRKFNRNGPTLNMCSVNCFNLYQVSLNAVNSKKTQCDFCLKSLQALYHLTMSDATIRNFCSYMCVMSFQNQYNKSPITMNEDAFPVPTGTPKKSKKPTKGEVNTRSSESSLPVISSVQSLANSNGTVPSSARTTRSKASPVPSPSPSTASVQNNIEIPVQVKHHIIIKNAPIPNQRNVGTMCHTRMSNKGVNAIPKVESVQVQTEKREAEKILIPVPVPIFVPLPMHMFAAPVPMPVPIPIPVPVPVFIPTTRNSANGIMKEIKKIQVKIPTNPYEAELLMMAEMVADDKKEENTDSESEVEDTGADDTGGGSFSPEPQDGSNTFGDDMLQMALKMATELDEPAVDLEGALTANTITASQTQDEVHTESSEEVSQEQLHLMDRGQRGRKRGIRGNSRGQGASISKRGRRSLSQHVDMPMMQQPVPPPEPQEKPDANMCLKYTFGVNAWKQWVTFKNAELEKSSRRVKLFKTEILQLTADELNYSLCLFVKEVRKPNGAEYAPDTIYYLCLGIQQYLFENGRIDNIFCDAYYEKFTDCLDEVAKRFSVLYNDSHYIVTRVEEEHLWESKQLGAHSPHVLLSTLMFFNTKHFNLTTVDEHMQLSFSHIMKHWKRNPNQAGASKIPGSRNVLLRFYPPQSAIQNNARKKKVYEQQENEENPLRCPVKLYEFYLSKCPESVKTRNDVFYLQPERSCVPDSPVWYSTMPLPKDALEKMLHRVKMVKEINVALLTS